MKNGNERTVEEATERMVVANAIATVAHKKAGSDYVLTTIRRLAPRLPAEHMPEVILVAEYLYGEMVATQSAYKAAALTSEGYSAEIERQREQIHEQGDAISRLEDEIASYHQPRGLWGWLRRAIAAWRCYG